MAGGEKEKKEKNGWLQKMMCCASGSGGGGGEEEVVEEKKKKKKKVTPDHLSRYKVSDEEAGVSDRPQARPLSSMGLGSVGRATSTRGDHSDFHDFSDRGMIEDEGSKVPGSLPGTIG